MPSKSHLPGGLLEGKSRAEGNRNLGDQENEGDRGSLPTPAIEQDKAGVTKEVELARVDAVTPATLPLTKYEKSRIIGTRALQISLGAPIIVQIPQGVVDPIVIADCELKANVLPITIKRKLPRGKFENVALSKLAKEWT